MDHRLSRSKHRRNKRYKPMTESEKRYFQKRYGMTPEEYDRRQHIDNTFLPDPTHGEFKMPQSRSNSRSLRREHEDRSSRGLDNRRSSLDPPSLQRSSLEPPSLRRNFYGSRDERSSLEPPSLQRSSIDPFSLHGSSGGSRVERSSLEPPSLQRSSSGSRVERSSLDPPSLHGSSRDPSSLSRASLDPFSLHGSSRDPPSLSKTSLDPPSFRNEPSLQFSYYDPSTANITSFGDTLNFNPSTGKTSQAEKDIIESMKNINFDDI